MTKTIRSLAVLAAAVCMAGSMSFAQSEGAATYKAKCQMCHGANGTADPDGQDDGQSSRFPIRISRSSPKPI